MKITDTTPSDARPRAIARDAAVVLDGETVVVAEGQIHVLNGTASAIWERCDGSTSVDAIVAGLASEYHVSVEVLDREVQAALTDLVERGLVDLERAHAAASEARVIIETVPSCSGCGQGPDYEQQLLLDAGTVLVSVGCDHDVAELLERALGHRVVGRADPPHGRPSYGVVIPSRSGTAGREDLARLHRGPDVLLTSRSPERVLSGLLTQVASHDIPPGHTLLEGLAVGRSDRVVIRAVPANRVRFERAAARHGLAVSDAPVLALARGSMAVVIGAPQLRPNVEIMQAFARARARRHDNDIGTLTWGDYHVVGFGVEGNPGVPSVLGELGATAGPEGSAGSVLRELLDGFASRPILSCPSLEQIAELVR